MRAFDLVSPISLGAKAAIAMPSQRLTTHLSRYKTRQARVRSDESQVEAFQAKLWKIDGHCRGNRWRNIDRENGANGEAYRNQGGRFKLAYDCLSALRSIPLNLHGLSKAGCRFLIVALGQPLAKDMPGQVCADDAEKVANLHDNHQGDDQKRGLAQRGPADQRRRRDGRNQKHGENRKSPSPDRGSGNYTHHARKQNAARHHTVSSLLTSSTMIQLHKA